MQQQMFSPQEVYTRVRPQGPTSLQTEAFLLGLAEEVIEEGYSQDDPALIVEDLRDLLPFSENGYELAKELDRVGSAYYEIDVALCEWLDELAFRYCQIGTNNVKDWVKAHNPQPWFAVGAHLLLKQHIHSQLRAGTQVYVTALDASEARYVLGSQPDKPLGFLVDYEVVEAKCEQVSGPAARGDLPGKG